ncbi:hypothetical protein RJ640_027553 [Escallonia rubra]|uniref:Chalcone/stilbene synthase N-terminal domain-containing protein n=1 Tax=Escallonia rubra TaxID=112253 RepID=A0AA88U1H7_9ASTE|nr:hypothetical protein RJ640_027553 [Escallonia rubra]
MEKKPNTHYCGWNDIICDSTTKRIPTLQFSWGNISGQFPAVVDDLLSYIALSLDARQDMVVVEIPKLGKEAAARAIKEGGLPSSRSPISSSAPPLASTCLAPTTSSPSSSAFAPPSRGS